MGFPDVLVNNLAKYRVEYRRIPLSERMYIDFDYFMRCKYVSYLRKDKFSVK